MSGKGQRSGGGGADVFFFPEETVTEGVTQLCKEAVDDTTPAVDTSDTSSEEFVMVEHEAGSGVLVSVSCSSKL